MKKVFIIVGFIVGIILAYNISQKMELKNQEALNFCLSQGNTETYCLKGLYG